MRIVFVSLLFKDMIRGVSLWYFLTIFFNKSVIFLFVFLLLFDFDILFSIFIVEEFLECVVLVDFFFGFGNVKFKYLLVGF